MRTSRRNRNSTITAKTESARYVPAAELMVLALIEVILGPFWVWLILDEAPTLLGLIGGVVVVGAVAYNAFAGLRRSRAKA